MKVLDSSEIERIAIDCHSAAFRIARQDRRDVKEAEDFAQDATLKVLGFLRDGDLTRVHGTLLGYCRRIVANHWIDRHRAKSRSLRAIYVESLEREAAEILDHSETARALECVESLSETDRSMVNQYFHERESYSTIAQSLRKSKSWVALQFRRILAELKDCMGLESGTGRVAGGATEVAGG